MCMTFAAALPGCGTIVATDRRISGERDGKQVRYLDAGGKLFRLGSHWITFTGRARNIDAALERLASQHRNNTPAIVGALAAAVRAAPEPDAFTGFLVANADGLTRVSWDGALDAPLACCSLPWHPDNSLRDVRAALLGAVTAACSWPALLRLTAAAFARAAELSSYLSPSIEVGLGAGAFYLTGDSATIAQASDRTLMAMLQPPPASTGPHATLRHLRRTNEELAFPFSRSPIPI